MIRRVPLLAVVLGLAGLAPFVLLGLLAIGPDLAQAERMTLLLIGYGAAVLAFLGGVHWGFALIEQDTAPARAERARLLLGVAPSLVGWAALALPLVGLPQWSGLLVLVGGFLGTVVVEHRARQRGLMPPGYMWLRWGLTAVVLAMLVTVLTLRILGQNLNL